MENTLNYDKHIELLDSYLGHEQRARFNRIGGHSVWQGGYQVDGYVYCYCTKCGAEFHGKIEGFYTDSEEHRARINMDMSGTKKDDPKLGDECPICGNPFYVCKYDEYRYWGDNVILFRAFSFSQDKIKEIKDKWRNEVTYY